MADVVCQAAATARATRFATARITRARSFADADRMLAQVREEMTGLLTEVRRLVQGLRPPALDDVGLAKAIRQQAQQMSGAGLVVTVDDGEDLGPCLQRSRWRRTESSPRR